MQRIVWLFIFVSVFAVKHASADSYTFVVSPEQQAVLETEAKQQGVTPDALIQQELLARIEVWKTQKARTEYEKVLRAYSNAAPSDQMIIKRQLNVSP